jgi:NACHT domain
MVNRAKRPDRGHLLAAVGHPVRRDGAIALVLFLAPWVAVLFLVRGHQHLDTGTKVAVIFGLATVSIGLPTLWVTWAGYRGPRPPADLSMAEVADQLAVAVGTQWSAEAAVRRLNDPYPLPVSWAAADASLTDVWDSLVTLATSGAGWPPPAGTWAAAPEDLDGKGGELAEVLTRVPTGRLVVLGEPGAGKTMLMVRLVLDLLARRAAGGPVPILASVATWNPTDASQNLRGWLGAQLMIDHPALAAPPPEGRVELTQAEALLAAGLILPVLDGLDEIPEGVRGSAISKINSALRPGEQLVVTCRCKEYRDAVRPQDGIEVTLRGAAAVQLRPLDADAVRKYLYQDAAGPVARARWDPVLAVLGTEAPAGQALSSPLMVGLARAIYDPRPGELAGELRKPEELCSPAMTDRTVVESVLFDAFIPAAYRNDLTGRWEAQDAEKWLVFLARHLERRIASPDLAWWQLRRAVPPRTFELAAGFGVALLAGLCSVVVIGLTPATGHGFVNGLRNGLLGGLGIAVVVAFMPVFGAYLPWSLFWPRKRNTKAPSRSIRTGAGAPSRGIRMNAKGLVAGLVFGLVFGLLTGLAAEFAGRAAGGLGTGLGSGLTVGYVVGLVRGLAAAPGDLAATASPREVLARDQRAAVILTLTVGLGFGLIVGLVAGLRFGLTAGVGVGLAAGIGIGLAAGLVAGLLASMIQTAWPSYMLATRWLAFRRHLPRSLMSFLADAHQRGVLRQAGAVYQFRHIELEHRLASAPGKIGSCFDVRDVDGNQARVTLVKVIDSARGADQYITPDNAKRFVDAVIEIEALSGKGGNARAALIGSNGETYAADVAWYANFRVGRFRVLGETVTRAVTFQVPDGVKVEEVQLTAGNGFSSTARWDVRS